MKLIVQGEVTKKVTVKLQGASKSAVEQITKAGGTFTVTERIARTAKPKTAEK